MSYGRYEEMYGIINQLGGPEDKKEDLPDLDLPDDEEDDDDDLDEEEESSEESEEDLPPSESEPNE